MSGKRHPLVTDEVIDRAAQHLAQEFVTANGPDASADYSWRKSDKVFKDDFRRKAKAILEAAFAGVETADIYVLATKPLDGSDPRIGCPNDDEITTSYSVVLEDWSGRVRNSGSMLGAFKAHVVLGAETEC